MLHSYNLPCKLCTVLKLYSVHTIPLTVIITMLTAKCILILSPVAEMYTAHRIKAVAKLWTINILQYSERKVSFILT